MNVFISWSGKQSKEVSGELANWLKWILPDITPRIASDRASSGSNWARSLTEDLNTARFCIICLTPENVRSPWLYFEAGSIAFWNGKLEVRGYLVGVDQSQLEGGPLAIFPWIEATAEGTSRLVREINAGLERPNDERVLQPAFRMGWAMLKQNLQNALIDTISTSADGETEALKPVYRLSAEAQTILREAAIDLHGSVLMTSTRHGLSIQANGKQLVTGEGDPRVEANWRGAIRELLQKGLLERMGSNREVFQLTHEGYLAASSSRANQKPARRNR